MEAEVTPLLALLTREIRAGGPIGLDRYMALCLGHPRHGSDATRDPLGRSGDFVTRGGALLAIDYGHDRPGFGDTFQALAGHRFADPLARPGEADLTVHVDFAALARAAAAEGAAVHGPVTQRDFLLALGLDQRAERLKTRATPDQAAAIEAARARLTDPDPRGMGALFKVLGASHPALGPLPAFPPPP